MQEHAMSIYKLFQIQLTDQEVDIINKANNHNTVPKNIARIKLGMACKDNDCSMLVKDSFAKNYFSNVANITAATLEGVFHTGNIGPEENIERLKPMHSVSVGDVIEDTVDGRLWIVADFGFQEV